jgi:hypothetical protein
MSSIDRTFRRCAAFAATALVSACGGDSGGGGGTGPRPVTGTAVVTLAGATAADAGVVLDVGEGVTAVTNGGGTATVGAGPQTADGHRRVIVLGDLSGALVRLSVPDVRQLPQVQVREVAGRDGSVRADLSGYAARVTVQ